jgi:hypothetical protein
MQLSSDSGREESVEITFRNDFLTEATPSSRTCLVTHRFVEKKLVGQEPSYLDSGTKVASVPNHVGVGEVDHDHIVLACKSEVSTAEVPTKEVIQKMSVIKSRKRRVCTGCTAWGVRRGVYGVGCRAWGVRRGVYGVVCI